MTRESPALEVKGSFSGRAVADLLVRLAQTVGLPKVIQVDLEAFKGRFRQESLHPNWFASLSGLTITGPKWSASTDQISSCLRMKYMLPKYFKKESY